MEIILRIRKGVPDIIMNPEGCRVHKSKEQFLTKEEE